MLETEHDLDSYLKDLPRHFIHFLEYPSIKNRYGTIFFHYDEKMQMISCAPYFKSRKHDITTMDPGINETDPKIVAVLGSTALTNLTCKGIDQVGDVFVFDYSKPDISEKIQRYKYLYAIDQFTGKMKEDAAMLPPGPNGLPFWIHIDLLPFIFEPRIPVRNKPSRQHGQYDIYLAAMKWIKEMNFQMEYQ